MWFKLAKRSRGWLGNIVLLVLIYWAVQAYQGRDAPDAGPAPPIEATDMQGAPISLENYRGQPTLLYFWATWCHVCALTRNSIDNIAQDHQVITIASQSGSDGAIQAYLKEHDFRATVINDSDNRLSREYGVQAFPTLFVLNAKGEIDDVEIGLSSEAGIRFRLWQAEN